MSAAQFNKFVALLDELYEKRDTLPDHTLRDAEGKVLHNQKHDSENSWYMQRLKELFPNEPFSCYALGVCLRHLCTHYITTIVQFKRAWPKLKRLSTWVAARQAQYFSDIKKALGEGKKSAAFKAQVADVVKQTPEEKVADNLLHPSKLDARVKDALVFDLVDFVKVIQENKDTTDKSTLGWVLEASIGSRSIDS